MRHKAMGLALEQARRARQAQKAALVAGSERVETTEGGVSVVFAEGATRRDLGGSKSGKRGRKVQPAEAALLSRLVARVWADVTGGDGVVLDAKGRVIEPAGQSVKGGESKDLP